MGGRGGVLVSAYEMNIDSLMLSHPMIIAPTVISNCSSYLTHVVTSKEIFINRTKQIIAW